MKKIGCLLLSICLLFAWAIPAAAQDVTYKITVPTRTGATNENSTYAITPQNPRAGEKVTVTLSTTRSGYAPQAVRFYDKTVWKETEIPGYTITRDYDDPNTFSFMMPPQDVDLKLVFAEKVRLYANPYPEEPDKPATPASEDGTIPATPYVHEGNPLTGTGSTLFTTEQGKSIEGYLYKFSDGRDYGVVDTAGTCWSYTPNAAAAGKTVTICLKAWSGGSVSNEIQFSVRVNTVPQPAKSRDTSLQKLTYSVAGGPLQEIPVEAGKTEYSVALPVGTAEDQSITVAPVPTHGQAQVNHTQNAVTSYVGSNAAFAVQAEDPSAAQSYQVSFAITPPDVPYGVSDGVREYGDGDTIRLSVGEVQVLEACIGAGTSGAGSVSIRAADEGHILRQFPASQTFTGIYPSIFSLLRFEAIREGSAQVTINFYESTSIRDLDGETPLETIRLSIVASPEPSPVVPDTDVTLDKAALSLEPGQTAKLKAALTPSDATYKYIFWTSSDEAVATVSDSGIVTAMADGTATVTAKSWYGHEAVCAVTVKTPDEPTPPQPVDPWPTEGLAGFVTRCYRVALSRDPDKAGHADWVRWLQDGTVDATTCTYGFVFSKEMNNKKLSDKAFVETLYKLFMDREGEAAGVAFWVKYLADGHSREEVFYGFADSAEFGRIKTSYGLG